MTFTYASSPTTNRDKVRLLIGDTVSTNPLFTDEELCFFEGEFGTSIYATALAAIDVAIPMLARKASSKSVGGLSISYASRIDNLEKAKKVIESLARKKVGAPTPYAGGISIADKEIDESDTDIPSGFAIGQMDNPGANTFDTLTELADRNRD